MIADRVRETDEYEYEGWSPEEILDPTRKSYIFDSSLSFLSPIYCRKGAAKINDLDRSLGLRKLLKKYPPFIHIEGYESDASSRAETGWIEGIEKATESLHISTQRGFGWQNQYSNCERVLKPISLLKLQDQRSSLTAEIVDSDQVHGKSTHKIAKILFIQNEGRIAPYKTKGLVNLELDAKPLEKKMQEPLLHLIRVEAMQNFSRQSANQQWVFWKVRDFIVLEEG